MTAEIAVLNTGGVALAADSAVSISNGASDSTKVYNSATKLLALSKYHPVGVMIFGSAGVAGRPWEMALKVFREQLGDTEYDTLDGYLEHLLEFLRSDRTVFSEAARRMNVRLRALGEVANLREVLLGSIKAMIDEGKNVTETSLKRLVQSVVEQATPSEDLQDERTGFLGLHRQELDLAVTDILEQLPMFKKTRELLIEILAETFVDPDLIVEQTGIVVAGYGRAEVFPRLLAVSFDCISLGRVHYRPRASVDIDPFTNRAVVFPFAQRDMANLFVEGIHPAVEQAILKAISTALEELPRQLAELLDVDLTKEKLDALDAAVSEASDAFRREHERAKDELSIHPLIDVVALLPRDELAAMAETLINLTSFRRRMSLNAETVGGPVDVAVISKGDGFVWVSRKHYFPADTNHAYFANYFRRRDDL